jgi:predicted enzyme related to lactoylglutathione lyase
VHLGIPIEQGGWHVFQWRERDDPEQVGSTVLSLFKSDTTYFGPGEPAFMLNYRVDDLEALIAKLRAEGVSVSDERHQDENGRFAWITDPEGHLIELWEPAPGH